MVVSAAGGCCQSCASLIVSRSFVAQSRCCIPVDAQLNKPRARSAVPGTTSDISHRRPRTVSWFQSCGPIRTDVGVCPKAPNWFKRASNGDGDGDGDGVQLRRPYPVVVPLYRCSVHKQLWRLGRLAVLFVVRLVCSQGGFTDHSVLKKTRVVFWLSAFNQGFPFVLTPLHRPRLCRRPRRRRRCPLRRPLRRPPSASSSAPVRACRRFHHVAHFTPRRHLTPQTGRTATEVLSHHLEAIEVRPIEQRQNNGRRRGWGGNAAEMCQNSGRNVAECLTPH